MSMSKQLLISVSREFGSGGREIAHILAKRFDINYYDRNLLDEIAEENSFNAEKLRKFDEKPRRLFFSRTSRGETNSPELIVANYQFDYLVKKANEGESFVIVGRCADEILSSYDGIIKLFILADEECKIKRIAESRNVNPDQAKSIMHRHDRKRKRYHNYYCTIKWGDSRGYDLSINTSRLGIEKTADFLEQYIRERFEIES